MLIIALLKSTYAPVAQGIEQLPSKQLVGGSNPSRCASFIFRINMEQKKNFVGTCVNSFDESNADCIIPELPFSNASDFAYYVENSKPISKEVFLQKSFIPDFLFNLINQNNEFSEYKNVIFLYDTEEDIHYFFI